MSERHGSAGVLCQTATEITAGHSLCKPPHNGQPIHDQKTSQRDRRLATIVLTNQSASPTRNSQGLAYVIPVCKTRLGVAVVFRGKVYVDQGRGWVGRVGGERAEGRWGGSGEGGQGQKMVDGTCVGVSGASAPHLSIRAERLILS